MAQPEGLFYTNEMIRGWLEQKARATEIDTGSSSALGHWRFVPLTHGPDPISHPDVLRELNLSRKVVKSLE